MKALSLLRRMMGTLNPLSHSTDPQTGKVLKDLWGHFELELFGSQATLPVDALFLEDLGRSLSN